MSSPELKAAAFDAYKTSQEVRQTAYLTFVEVHDIANMIRYIPMWKIILSGKFDIKIINKNLTFMH